MIWSYSKDDIILIFRELGTILMIVSFVLLLPLITAYIYGERSVFKPFLISAIFPAAYGVAFRLFSTNATLEKKHAIGLVVLAWPIISLPSALPIYLINPSPQKISYLDAYFEAMSGWTTTGLTTFGGHADGFFYSVNLWRHLMQFLGGLGIIVMGVVVLAPLIGWKDKMELMNAAGRSYRIRPSLGNTIKFIAVIYTVLMIIGTILFVIAGLSVFDALCHSMAGFSTGGFSTRSGSIMDYRSLSVTTVSIPIMILGGTNFAILYILFTGKIKEYFKDIETKLFWTLIVTFTLLALLWYHLRFGEFGIFFSFGVHDYPGFIDVIFMLTSSLTTTGWNSIPWSVWSATFAPLFFILIIFCMLVGANTSSTGGGIKAARVGLIIKSFFWHIERSVLPDSAVTKKEYRHLENKFLKDKELIQIFNFVMIYLFVLFVSFMIFLILGQEILPSFFEVTSALGTVGLSSGITSIELNPILKIVLIINMWVGRIEIFPILYFIRYIILRRN